MKTLIDVVSYVGEFTDLIARLVLNVFIIAGLALIAALVAHEVLMWMGS